MKLSNLKLIAIVINCRCLLHIRVSVNALEEIELKRFVSFFKLHSFSIFNIFLCVMCILKCFLQFSVSYKYINNRNLIITYIYILFINRYTYIYVDINLEKEFS